MTSTGIYNNVLALWKWLFYDVEQPLLPYKTGSFGTPNRLFCIAKQ